MMIKLQVIIVPVLFKDMGAEQSTRGGNVNREAETALRVGSSAHGLVNTSDRGGCLRGEGNQEDEATWEPKKNVFQKECSAHSVNAA